MNPGAMDRIVTLKVRSNATTGDYGEQTWTYTEYEVWAERRELRGSERYEASQVVDTFDCKYRIRYREDLSVKDLLVDGDDTFDIVAILPLGRREGLELLCHTHGNQ